MMDLVVLVVGGDQASNLSTRTLPPDYEHQDTPAQSGAMRLPQALEPRADEENVLTRKLDGGGTADLDLRKDTVD